MTIRANIRNLPDMNAKTPPTDEEVDQRYKDNNENDEWYFTADADVARYNGLLDKYKTVEALSKYGTSKVVAWEKSTLQLKKEIAAVIVALRKQFTSSKGEFPDWDGRTQAYKLAKRRMLQNSGVPQQTLLSIENAVRYHVQNLVVMVAPKKELEVLDMLTTSRRERQNERQNQPPPETPTPEPTTPAAVVVAGVEIQPEKPKGNQAEYLLMVVRDMLDTVLKSKDLAKADKKVVQELTRVIVEDKIAKINDKLSEAYEKAEKRKAQSAQRRAAAADAAA